MIITEEMSARDQISNIRVVRVTKGGKSSGFSAFGDSLARISPSGFVAIDAEFSGLGQDDDLKHDNLEVRYKALRKIANTRAIFSVGVSMFDRLPEDTSTTDADSANVDMPSGSEASVSGTQTSSYEVATFELLMSCQSEFSLTADAGAFLTSHGFDFNELFQKGIPYERASTEKPSEKENDKTLGWRWGKMPKGLLWRIGRQAIPLIVHNGLSDLIFLYAAFQGPLPETLNGFVSALLECTPAGYWDTKVVATSAEERASYLGYLFAKSVVAGKLTLSLSSGLPPDHLTDPKKIMEVDTKDRLCALYAFKGFCPRGAGCPFLHDPFKVLEEEKNDTVAKDSKDAYKRHKLQNLELKRQKASARKELSTMSKKRKKALAGVESTLISPGGESHERKGENTFSSGNDSTRLMTFDKEKTADTVGRRNRFHSAGWDAFCTGYVFASYRASISTVTLSKDRNRIALPYKLTPLFLCKSRFADLDIKGTPKETTR